jgi:hypothetical protein
MPFANTATADFEALTSELDRSGIIALDDVATLPHDPGIYIFELRCDATGLYHHAVENSLTLYVGSTTGSLRERLSSYRSKFELADGIAYDAVGIRSITLSAPLARYGEQLLLESWKPVWNSGGPAPGISINAPGRRRQPWRPPWHVLHPGWPPVAHLPTRHSIAELSRAVHDHFQNPEEQ